MERNHIHISLNKNQIAQFALLCKIQAKQIFAFIKNKRLRCVEIFRGGIIQNATAKANHISPHIDNGEHESIAESIINPAILLAYQIGIDQFLLSVALALHSIHQGMP